MIERRLRGLSFLFFTGFVIVLLRSFSFQIIGREPWIQAAEAQYEHREPLPAERGTIYDRNLNVLALDISSVSLAVDPSMLPSSEAVACSLQTVLGGAKTEFLSRLKTSGFSKYHPLQLVLSTREKDRLMATGIPGLIFEPRQQRVHPRNDLALQVLGVTDNSRCGAWGIEQELNGRLAGMDGWAVRQWDGLKRYHVSLDLPRQEARPGQDVVLTLDHAIQEVLDEEISKGVETYQAKFGTGILLDPFSGEVLAMTTAIGPESRTGQLDFSARMMNRAVQWQFEPGSVFKIVTAAAALEEGAFNPKSLIFCENGSYIVNKREINDHNNSFAWLTLNQVMEHSSNIGMAKVGQKLGDKTLCRYAQNFGFGNKTGIRLPGETAGILRPVYQWTPSSIVSISFGQEISASALQIAGMTAVVANGGELIEPRIVKQILGQDGRVLMQTKRRVIRRVISPQTADQLTDILVNVVKRGSGMKAMVPGVTVAGKTGTAQKSIEGHRGYVRGVDVSSFTGFWPAETPRYVLVIVLDEPALGSWGSLSAAPIFAQVVKRISGLPSLQGGGGSPLVQTQTSSSAVPQAQFTSFESNANPEVKTKAAVSMPALNSSHHIPDLRGLSVRQALHSLAELNVKARVIGSGIIKTQWPKPGTRISDNIVCQLSCGDQTPVKGNQ